MYKMREKSHCHFLSNFFLFLDYCHTEKVVQWYSISFLIQRLLVRAHTCSLKAFAQYFFNIPCKFMNSFQVV
jgi:hypothetical protein